MTELSSKDLTSQKISVCDPFAEFLGASQEETRFDISLLDVVRFSGHACLSITGAFLMAKVATQKLFPETNCCERGKVEIFLKGSPTQGATGPIANVFGYITGAWAESGFGGFNGAFARRGLLHFESDIPDGVVRFRRIDTGLTIDVRYLPNSYSLDSERSEAVQTRWRKQIARILNAPDNAIETQVVDTKLDNPA